MTTLAANTITPSYARERFGNTCASFSGVSSQRPVICKGCSNSSSLLGKQPYIEPARICGCNSLLYARDRPGGLRVTHTQFPTDLACKRGNGEPGAGGAGVPPGRHLHLVLGPPGTGKTTRLLGLLQAELDRGVPVSQVAFVSFTRAARQEACARVCRQLYLGQDDLPWFRTVHSAAFRLLGLKREQVLGAAHWRDFARRYGYELTDSACSDEDDDPHAVPARTDDDLLRYMLEESGDNHFMLDLAEDRVKVGPCAAPESRPWTYR